MKPWLSSLSQSAKKNDADKIITSCTIVIKTFLKLIIIFLNLPLLSQKRKTKTVNNARITAVFPNFVYKIENESNNIFIKIMYLKT